MTASHLKVVPKAPTKAKPTVRSTIAAAARATDKPSKPVEVRSKAVPGLLLRTQPSGTKTFYVQVGRGKRVRLGDARVLTLGQAEERARAILLNPGIASANKPVASATLEEYLDRVYEEHAVTTTKTGKATVKRIKALWPTLLGKRMSDIAKDDVDKLRKKRLADGASAGTVNRDTFPLRGVLTHWAKEVGVVHPLRDLKPFPVDRDEVVRYLTPAEEKRLRKALADRDAKMIKARESANAWRLAREYDPLPALSGYGDYLTPMVALSLATGLRQGEAFSLTWGDVDMHEETVTVRASKAKGRRTRVIPANRDAMAVLKAIRPKDPAGTDLVFPSRVTGERLTNVKRAWGEVMKAAKLPQDFVWHGLRHTFAMRLLDADVPIYSIKALLGHANLATTEIYARVRAENLKAAVKKLDR